ncbi:hypothetical protein [Polaromonas sp. AET17H-212]|uniref:hypothetical protein n=1 Tax=Polaromonas sp. AET17H-212 TaxID=1977061 RepID=UPI001144F297|nr:hypothetical protein [Polaromonas sp. AET17H-212]
MQDYNDSSSHIQLSFDFEQGRPLAETPNFSAVANVIHVQFGLRDAPSGHTSHEDNAILERVLLNAQKLKW